MVTAATLAPAGAPGKAKLKFILASREPPPGASDTRVGPSGEWDLCGPRRRGRADTRPVGHVSRITAERSSR